MDTRRQSHTSPRNSTAWGPPPAELYQRKPLRLQGVDLQPRKTCAAALLRALVDVLPVLPFGALLRLSWTLPALTACSSSGDSSLRESCDKGCLCGSASTLKGQAAVNAPPHRVAKEWALPVPPLVATAQVAGVQQNEKQQQTESWRDAKRVLAAALVQRLEDLILPAAAGSRAAANAAATEAALLEYPLALVKAASGVSRLLPRSKCYLEFEGPPGAVPGIVSPALRSRATAHVVGPLVCRLGELATAPFADVSSWRASASSSATRSAAGGERASTAGGRCRSLSLREWSSLLAAHSRLLLPLSRSVRGALQKEILRADARGGHLGGPLNSPPEAFARVGATEDASGDPTEASIAFAWSREARRDCCSVLQCLAKLHERTLLRLLWHACAPQLAAHFAAAETRLAASNPLCVIPSSGGSTGSRKGTCSACEGRGDSAHGLQEVAADALATDAATAISACSVMLGVLQIPRRATGGLSPSSTQPGVLGRTTLQATAFQHTMLWLRAALSALAAAEVLRGASRAEEKSEDPLHRPLGYRNFLAGSSEGVSRANAKSLESNSLRTLLEDLPLHTLQWLLAQVEGSPKGPRGRTSRMEMQVVATIQQLLRTERSPRDFEALKGHPQRLAFAETPWRICREGSALCFSIDCALMPNMAASQTRLDTYLPSSKPPAFRPLTHDAVPMSVLPPLARGFTDQAQAAAALNASTDASAVSPAAAAQQAAPAAAGFQGWPSSPMLHYPQGGPLPSHAPVPPGALGAPGVPQTPQLEAVNLRISALMDLVRC
ncbi:hypothetical protein cyc_00500 [Cyclospora cayetanensis]|uniref:Uncharacterized protein n=1 Tax=Cyclospora cayetanensis TaxID=88456 RepID=A0A1D3D6P1_9EIME|nr:hypothetical protein cyc_00500 [Cyclospora cayetanensis]